MKNSEGKYKAEYRQGYWNSIDRTNDADDIAEFETEFGVYLKKKRGWATLPEQIEKTKQLMASTILLLQILPTMVLLQKISHPTNLAQ